MGMKAVKKLDQNENNENPFALKNLEKEKER